MLEVQRFVFRKILTRPVSSLATSGDMFSYIQECQGLLYVQTGQTFIIISTGPPVASTYIINELAPITSISFDQTETRISMFPSCSGFIRPLNISFVFLYTYPVTIFYFVNYIEILLLNVSCISVKQFPTLIFLKIIV